MTVFKAPTGNKYNIPSCLSGDAAHKYFTKQKVNVVVDQSRNYGNNNRISLGVGINYRLTGINLVNLSRIVYL